MNPNLKSKMDKKVRHSLAQKEDRAKEKLFDISEQILQLRRAAIYHGEDARLRTTSGEDTVANLIKMNQERLKFLAINKNKTDRELIELHDALEASLSEDCRKDYVPKKESDAKLLVKMDLAVILLGLIP